MKESKIGAISVIENENKSPERGPAFLSAEATAAAHRIHQKMPDYRYTPLVRLDGMAKKLGVRAVLVKDESKRFGLNAFKALGGLYALTCIVCQRLGLDAETVSFSDLKKAEYADEIGRMVFVTATDGNHGRGVAWAAGQLGCEVHVFMPVGSSEIRAQAIRDVNPKADVRIMDIGYDAAVAYAAAQAEEHGWTLVQDTSWDGYEDIPRWIVQGYTTMAMEACEQMREAGLSPTHVFVQAGVGAMAGGVVGYLANALEGCRPKFGVVEPEAIACIYASAKAGDGAAHGAVDQKPTIMAGLNCGEPCTLTWPVLRDFADWYIMCPDYITAYGMRLLASPENGDPKVISGESGAVTVGLVNAAARLPEYAALKEKLALDENSVVLCFSTEGDTDPERYREIVSENKYPMPQEFSAK